MNIQNSLQDFFCIVFCDCLFPSLFLILFFFKHFKNLSRRWKSLTFSVWHRHSP